MSFAEQMTDEVVAERGRISPVLLFAAKITNNFFGLFSVVFATHYILCLVREKCHNPLALSGFLGFLENEMKNEKQSKTA